MKSMCVLWREPFLWRCARAGGSNGRARCTDGGSRHENVQESARAPALCVVRGRHRLVDHHTPDGQRLELFRCHVCPGFRIVMIFMSGSSFYVLRTLKQQHIISENGGLPVRFLGLPAVVVLCSRLFVRVAGRCHCSYHAAVLARPGLPAFSRSHSQVAPAVGR
jgi:hypothetical protein